MHWKQLSIVVAATLCLALSAQALSAQERYPHSASFRLPASDTIPEVESAQQVIFTDTVSGIPAGAGIDRITAPPLTVVLGQRLVLRDADNAENYSDVAPAVVWEPGMNTVALHGSAISWKVEQVALFEPRGFLLRVEIHNHSERRKNLIFTSTQQPSIQRPEHWNWDPTFRMDRLAAGTADGPVVVHQNAAGAVAVALAGGKSESSGTGSNLERRLRLEAGGDAVIHVAIVVAENGASASTAVQRLIEQPEQAAAASRERMDRNIEDWLGRLPVLRHPDERVVRFYRQAAVQLVWSRWKLGKTLVLDPWYSTSGRDSGALNAYAWDLQYAALAMALLDPMAMRALLVALPAAPLTEHFSIDPLHGAGLGPFYSYSSYTYTASVDEYLRRTGDWSLLSERSGGKTILEWLVELAQWGEADRDPDGNGLLDCGNDKNMLELKKTGTGPGYINEVPSPNGERVWVYATVAEYMERLEPVRYREEIARFRRQSERVRHALNDVLWLDGPGWYGARQRDGSVVPVYSIQIFDLLRFPGLVPADRARRLAGHLNQEEFLGPWGVRSMSIKDRLFDYNDHDWAGPMTYAGDGPQLVADLYGAGFAREADDALRRVLWWPEHMAVYPQGIANDDYGSRYPASREFGGRISAGRSNVIAGCTGVEAIVRGLFGITPGWDGSLGFAHNHKPGDGPYTMSYPFRGGMWTVTQDDGGVQLKTDSNLELRVDRTGVVVRVAADRERVRIQVNARADGAGKVVVGLSGLVKNLGVRSATGLRVVVNGKPAELPVGDVWTVEFRERTVELEIAAANRQ